jgi:macrolide-specific efflux system membrane fusion protein
MYSMKISVAALAACAACCSAVQGQEAQQLEVSSVLVTQLEQVEVPARQPGMLASMSVREGEIVEPGQELARIDDSIAQLELNQARIEFETARALAANDVKVRLAEKSSAVAAADLRRGLESEALVPKSVSATELDRLRLAAERGELEVEQAKFEFEAAQWVLRSRENQLRLAESNVEQHTINAPIAGIVVQVHHRRGEWVEAGDKFARILRTDRLRAEGLLQGDDLPADAAGSSVTLRVSANGQPHREYTGTLVFVSPEINPVDGRVRVWAEIENHDGLLKSGTPASMTISIGAPAQKVENSGQP